MRFCPTCSTDWGFPNVRIATQETELAALAKRFDEAKRNAQRNGCEGPFDSFTATVEQSSHVVVALGTLEARKFLSDPRAIYQSYDTLVEVGSRTPAPLADDVNRQVAGSHLFGCFKGEIRYGALSLDGSGLPSYGKVYFRLRDIAIEKRVSLLESNSFSFVKSHRLTLGKSVPLGFRCGWRDRHRLAAAKVQPKLRRSHSKADWPRLLLAASSSNDRSKDVFIEAHIFGGFDSEAVEDVQFASGGKLSSQERRDIEAIKDIRQISP
jgi:hypothetical protein